MALDPKIAIQITADVEQAADELGRVGDGLDQVSGEAKQAASNTDLLSTGLKGVAAALSADYLLGKAADLAAVADQYNNMAGRLKLVAGEGAGLAAALESVRTVANASGADIDATATLYTRLAQASKELGFSQTELVGLTDTITKSFAVSGASAAEAEGAIRQFAQGLAAGALRGDEFNSVMEQSPRLAQALAAGLGVGIGELRKLAEEGKLTAETVTRALQSQAAAIEADFGKMPETIGRATQRLSNEWAVFVGQLDQTTGASASVADAIGSLAKNLDQVADAAAYAGEIALAAFSVKAAGALRAYAAEAVATAAATTAATREAAAAEVIRAKANQTAAKSEFEKATATRAATVATLADLEATLASARAAAIYGPQRAALERDVAAARTASAAASAAAARAEAAYGSALTATAAATGAVVTQTTALAAVAARVGGIIAGIAPLLKTIGYAAIAIEVYDLARNLMVLRDEYEKHEEIARNTAEAQDKVKDALARISRQTGVTVGSMADLDKAVEEGRLHFSQASGTWDRGAEVLSKVGEQAKQTKVELEKLAEAAEENAKKLAKSLSEFGLQDLEQKLIDQFRALAENPAANGSQILSGLLLSLKDLTDKRAPELALALRRAFDRKQIGLDEFLSGQNAIETKMRGLWSEADKAKASTDALKKAFVDLGITSQAALQETANKAKENFDLIKNSGASINDQAAAWTAYANKAIAANGGVASSILQAEAAQHGLTIVIDESGKASIRTKDALEGMADAARRAADEIAGANTQVMESAAIAASQARSSIGSVGESIGGFRQHIQEMGGALSGVINTARQDMANLSDAALAMYQSMDFGNAGESIGMFLEDVARNTATVTALFNEQAQTAEYWRQRLADGVDTAGDLTTATQVLGSQLTILGNEQLDPLRNAITDAERRMLDLRDAAQSTLDSIQDEWDQLNNNLDEIERRRAAKREAELQAQIAAAKASGDKEAIADLAKALELLKQVTAARIADAKQREKDAASNKSGGTTSKPSGSGGGTTTTSSGTTRSAAPINININGTVTNSPAELARMLKPDLDRLQRLGG